MAATFQQWSAEMLARAAEVPGFAHNPGLSPESMAGQGPADAPPAPTRRRKRTRVARESRDMGLMAARVLMAMARRAEAGDLEALAELNRLDLALRLAQARAAHGLHAHHGYSQAEIALRLGVTQQAVQKRWFARQ